MTREDLIKLAREAGIEWQQHRGITGAWNTSTCGSQSIEKMERLAALVEAAEREDCANLCDWLNGEKRLTPAGCAAAIRAMGQS